MVRWRPLSSDVPIEVARLVRDMRQHMDRSGVNAATLASRTGYSRSSWARYLNGRRLPPWPAVEGLGRLTQADGEQLRVRWESAAHAWTPARRNDGVDPRNDAADSQQQAPPGPAGRAEAPGEATAAFAPVVTAFRRIPLGYGWRAAAVAAGAAACCALLVGVLFFGPWSGAGVGRPPRGAPSGDPAWPWAFDAGTDQPAVACRSAGCRGLDPYKERCDRDRVVVNRLTAYGHVLALWYSPACLASWAEVETPEGTTELGVTVNGGGHEAAGAGRAYTAMVASGPDAVRATVVVAGHQLGVGRYDSWLDSVTGKEPG